MEDLPNARTEDGKKYAVVGDHLRIRYFANRGESGWLEFSPANLYIELNGQQLQTCKEVSITVKELGIPEATIKMDLEGIDIDADTLTRLAAFVKIPEEVDLVE
jgi:hypothetical protein